jgi:hypothetical protein
MENAIRIDCPCGQNKEINCIKSISYLTVFNRIKRDTGGIPTKDP